MNCYTVAHDHIKTLEKDIVERLGEEYKYAGICGVLEANLGSILFTISYRHPETYKEIVEYLKHNK